MTPDSRTIQLIDVTPENFHEHPSAICFINPKHPQFSLKVNWYKKEYRNGLKIKLLYLQGEKKAIGYIEYVPGEFCWRGVEASGYVFVHCLWINGNKYKDQGLGTQLLKEVEKEAVDTKGVAVLVSDKPFMAEAKLFEKNDYELVSTSGKDSLLVKRFKNTDPPSFADWEEKLSKLQGLNISYSCQCPWVARFIEEVKPVLKDLKLELNIHQIKSAKEAQDAPSAYSVFNLVYDGKLLSDRYISVTRFKNIMNKISAC